MKLALILLLPLLSYAMPSKQEQLKYSVKSIIANATMPDVKPGMVVASPSKSDPNYYYDWVRDTALTYSALVDYYALKKDSKILSMIKDWVQSETDRQNKWSLTGLGEPKYNIDGTSFDGPWGRPQNDGPALRALAMIKFARIQLANNDADYVIKKLYRGILPADSVIKKDLEYTAYHWDEASFDLWEEEKGMHFYTLIAQYTALKEGAALASELLDEGAAQFYKEEAFKIKNYITRTFHDDVIGIKATVDKVGGGLYYKSSNIDVAVLLGLLHNYPYQDIYKFNDARVKKYIEALKNSFKVAYTLNHKNTTPAVAIGRYPEDRYDGYGTNGTGNPWFLATAGLGEYYCLLQKTNGKKSYADVIEAQFQMVIYHSDRQGHLSEQFNRDNGIMQGARDLTWSYSSFLTAMMRCGLAR